MPSGKMDRGTCFFSVVEVWVGKVAASAGAGAMIVNLS